MTQPLCRYCGGSIRKRTKVNWIERQHRVYMTESQFSRYIVCDEPPTTIADCRKMTNEVVVSVQRGAGGSIRSFGTWDGKSYVDKFFCNGEHARKFAYSCAHRGMATPDYIAAERKQEQAA